MYVKSCYRPILSDEYLKFKVLMIETKNFEPQLDVIQKCIRSSDCSKLGHYTGSCKTNRGPAPTGEFSSLQFHCFRIIRTEIMMSSVENFLNRSYSRFLSTTTTTTACISFMYQTVVKSHVNCYHCSESSQLRDKYM